MKEKEYEVLREIYEEERIYIVRNEDIEKDAYLHDAYNEYGQKWDAEGASDYSLHNGEGDWAFRDMIKEGVKKFGEAFADVEINLRNLTVENYEDLDGIEASEEDLNAWISGWEEENANYTTTDYITWWNGHNFRTHVIDAEEYGATLKRVDDKLAEEILSAYKEVDGWEDYGTGSKCRVGEYLFKTTRFPHFYEAEVIIGEEE